MSQLTNRVFTSIVHVSLALFLCMSAYFTWLRVGQVTDVPWGCDLFGHLRIAQEFREARSANRIPQFRYHTPQVSQLINWFKSTGTSPEQWSEMVAPQAHHYVERTQSVIDQYPPGTGLVLSLFPEGKSVQGLVTFEIAVLLVCSLMLLGWTWKRDAWVSAGMIALGTYYVFDLLNKHEIGNYSVNAMILPMIFAAVFCLLSRLSEYSFKWLGIGSGPLSSMLAGIFTGISFLVRVPYFLQIPGWLFLVPKKEQQLKWYTF